MKHQESPFYGIFAQFIDEIQTLCNIQCSEVQPGVTFMLQRLKSLFYPKFFCWLS